MLPVVLMQRYHCGMGKDRFLSVGEAALMLGVGEQTVKRMIRHGLLPRYRYRGVYVRVRERDVLTFEHVPRRWLDLC